MTCPQDFYQGNEVNISVFIVFVIERKNYLIVTFLFQLFLTKQSEKFCLHVKNWNFIIDILLFSVCN
jgi:hypothetical protein